MAIYDPNPQPEWTPPVPQPGYTSVPADAQPMTGGDRWALVALAIAIAVVLAVRAFHRHSAPRHTERTQAESVRGAGER